MRVLGVENWHYANADSVAAQKKDCAADADATAPNESSGAE